MYRSSDSRPRGAILLMALVLIFLAAILVVKVIEEVTLQVRARAAQVSRDDLRFVGLSALETSLAVINEIRKIDDGSLNSPAQGWGDPIAYADELTWPEGVEVSVSVLDESGKFSLTEASPDTFKAFFDSMDVDYGDAETMTDSLLDWMDEDDAERLNGAEERFYENEELALTPANAPLKSWEALRYINGFREHFFDEDGVPNELHARFTRAFSLHTEGNPNLNSASEDILEALSEQYGFETDYFLDYMKGDDRVAGTYDDPVLKSADDLKAAGIVLDDMPVGYNVSLLKVEVRVTDGEKAYLLSALVETGEENTQNSGSGELTEGEQPATPEETLQPEAPATVTAGTDLPGRASNPSDAGFGDYPFTIRRLAESLIID